MPQGKNARSYWIAIVLLMVFMPLSFARPLEYYYQRYLNKQRPLQSESSVKEYYFQQAIDHEDPASGLFAQRYYIDESFGRSGDSPVFFYICGEAACESSVLSGAIRNYAKKYKAKLIALEHRFYGKSLPFPSLSTQNLVSLTTKSALQDLANFQQNISLNKHWTGKWVSFGGSYPGSLSAYYRLAYPELVVGALASSAPVQAKNDFYEYDSHVTEVAGVQCAGLIRLTVNEVEGILASQDKNAITKIKEMFSATAIHNDLDFLYLLADVGAGAVQYGMHDLFCSSLAASSSPLEGYANFTKLLFKKWDISALDLTAEGAMSEDPNHYSKGLGLRQWFYQSCTEYGYWQNANPERQKSTRSALINEDYHRNLCSRLFGIARVANTDLINSTYYTPLLNEPVTRIYFSNGSNDPWSTLSLTEKNRNNQNSNLTYNLIEGAAHCDDLRTPKENDSAALQSARQAFDELLNLWLG